MKTLDLVDLGGIAARLHVRPKTPAQWRKRGLLPPPDAMVSGAPAWQWLRIERWARETGRL